MNNGDDNDYCYYKFLKYISTLKNKIKNKKNYFKFNYFYIFLYVYLRKKIKEAIINFIHVLVKYFILFIDQQQLMLCLHNI